MSVAIGIDLGTTNTVVAAVVDGVAVTLEDEFGRRLLPSVVSFHPSGTVLVGEPARERRLVDPENTVFSVKPLIGRPYDSDEVKSAKVRFPFVLTPGAKNSTTVLSRDVAYAIPEISAFVLRRAKAVAESVLGEPVERAVITVPANFNDLQRASTKIAGKLAGLDVMRILNEPTAAALAYGQSIAKAEKIAVYDLGGGTFDVTLLDLTGNVFEVLATAGDTALGGDDIDRVVAERIALEVTRHFNYDPRTNPVEFSRLLFLAEEVKKDLSAALQTTREITGVGYTQGGNPIRFDFTFARAEFEQLVRPLVERTMLVAKQSIDVIGLSARDFDRVILVGGSTRMPLVARMVEQLFAQPPHLKVNPDEVVALGAAIQAHALNRSKAAHKRRPTEQQAPPPPPPPLQVPRPPPLPKEDLPPDTPQYFTFNKAPAVISFSGMPPGNPEAALPPPLPRHGRTDRGVKAPPSSRKEIEGTPVRSGLGDGAPVGPKPARRSAAPEALIPSTPDLDFDLDPPIPATSGPPLGEVVAAGDFFPSLDAELPIVPMVPALSDDLFAKGSAVATAESSPLLIDVTPLSLRVETVGGYSDILIPANSPVPCEKTRTFLTASDGQTSVFIRVAQGESARFAENARLGDLELSNLKAATRGEVVILVTFELDADGILNVSAKDKSTGRETKATMRLLGASTDAADMSAMVARQARAVVA